MIQKFRDWNHDRHQYAIDWKKRTGGKVMGYFCTYVPEELLYAADILPVRILGSHEPQDVTEPHMFGMYCPFSRDCLAQGLKGRYDYLDGIMIAHSCLHIRQTYSSWEKHVPRDFSYYLPVPQNLQTKHATPYLAEEYKDLKKALEDWVGREITQDDIQRGIDIMNENRSLIHKIYDMKVEENPVINGEETMQVAITQQLIDKRDHSKLLKKYIEHLAGDNTKYTDTRLMILGSENDDIDFVNMVEGCGSTIVIDEHCIGTRYFWNNVEQENGGDKLVQIAKRYVDKPPCPTKDWMERHRVTHILELAKKYDVKGAILIQQKFCDPHELDIPAIKKALAEVGISTLFLEFDVTVPIGQFKIRVEAFLEMIDDDDLF
jgi:benzoyl-CoA reductase subunit C